MRIKLLFAASLAVSATMAVGASAAQASNEAVCAFEGVSGTAQNPVDSIQTDLNDGNLQDKGGADSGPFEFGTTTADEATCAKVDTDTGDSANTGTYIVDIASEGTYVNQVCGTGDADDAAPSNTTLTQSGSEVTPDFDGSLEGPVSPTYEIDFVNGNGTLTVTGGTWEGRSLSGSGDIQIVPNDTNPAPGTVPCVTEDVSSFTVTGEFEASS